MFGTSWRLPVGMFSLLVASWAPITSGADEKVLDAGALADTTIFRATDLSPDGRRVVAHLDDPRFSTLVIRDIEENTTRLIDANAMGYRYEARWINDERLLAWVYETLDDGSEKLLGIAAIRHDAKLPQRPHGLVDPIIGPEKRADGPRQSGGGFATTKVRKMSRLTPGERLKPRELRILFRGETPSGVRLLSTIPEEKNTVLLSVRWDDDEYREAIRFNILTAERSQPAKPLKHILRWVADKNGELRAALQRKPGAKKDKILFRPESDDEWRSVAEVDRNELIPLQLDSDGVNLLVTALKGNEKYGIYRFRTEQKNLSGPLFSDDEHDVTEVVSSRWTGAPLYVRYQADQYRQVFVDENWRKLQTAVDRALDGTTNSVIASSRSENRHLIAAQASDRPTKYYFLDLDEGSMRGVASSRPEIQETGFVPVEAIKLAGSEAAPTSNANLTMSEKTTREGRPLVIRLPPSPYGRSNGLSGFDRLDQFLALRGFPVLELDTSLGRKIYEEDQSVSLSRWQDEVQNDLNAAVQWAAEQGYGKDGRICLMGQKLGALIALSIAQADRENFDCVIGFDGLLDPGLIDRVPPRMVGDAPYRPARIAVENIAYQAIAGDIVSGSPDGGKGRFPATLMIDGKRESEFSNLADQLEDVHSASVNVFEGSPAGAYEALLGFVEERMTPAPEKASRMD